MLVTDPQLTFEGLRPMSALIQLAVIQLSLLEQQCWDRTCLFFTIIIKQNIVVVRTA